MPIIKINSVTSTSGHAVDEAAVAEWVGLHYAKNFSTEGARRQEWIDRFVEAHPGDFTDSATETPAVQQVVVTGKPGTKLVRVILAALVRMEYTEVVEVPESMTESELQELADQRYRDVDGGLYEMDPSIWQQGRCYVTTEGTENVEPQLVAWQTADGLHIERAMQEEPASDRPVSMAYQVTEEDVETVLQEHWAQVANTNGRSFETMAAELIGTLDHQLIVKAALHGDDLDQQSVYASQEIVRQLRVNGVLEPLASTVADVTLPGGMSYRKTNETVCGVHIEFDAPITEANFKQACQAAVDLAKKECPQQTTIAVNFVAQGWEVQVVETTNVEDAFQLWHGRSCGRPIAFVVDGKSISDDDICSDCKSCQYAPGELSKCDKGWPGQEDGDGYVRSCASYELGADPKACEAALLQHGYVVGTRNPLVQPEFSGVFMVADLLDLESGYAIVGDDRDALVIEAHDHLLAM